MNISPVSSLAPDPALLQPTPGRGDFEKILQQSAAATAGDTDQSAQASREKEADEAATGLVSNALILPIFQQIRRSMLNDKGPFSPGKAEKVFGPQFDMQLADRIAQSPRLGVKTALVNKLLKRGQPAGNAGASPAGKLDVHG